MYTPSRQTYPSATLDPIYCEYLDEFTQALENRDEPRILELAGDPLLKELADEEILPYYRMLEEDHGLVTRYEDDTFSYYYENYENGYRHAWFDFCYDGTQINPEQFSSNDQWISLGFTEGDSYTSVDFYTNTFNNEEHRQQNRYSVYISYDQQKEPDTIQFSFIPDLLVEDHGSYLSWTSENALWKRCWLSGKFPVMLIGEADRMEMHRYIDEVDTYSDHWVENGTLTVYVDRGSGYQVEEVIPIRNGTVELTERMHVTKSEQDVNTAGQHWYQLFYDISENQMEHLGGSYADSEEDFLRHPIDFWW